MPEDEGLRVGGWVPPYSTDRDAGNLPARPALPGSPERLALGPGRSAPPQSARHFLILAAVAALGCGVTAIVALNRDDPPAPVAQDSRAPRPDLPAFPILPEETIPLLPAPTSKIPTMTAAAPVATRSPSPSRSWRTVSPTPARTTPAPPPAPPPAGLSTGSTEGLELADRPGYRVRHQHYEGRIAAISPSDREDVKNDARFVIHTGRAAADCFSFESVNFPGYYLRHRDFVIHLDRIDGSNLFDQDSTFCSESIRGGAAIALRAYNYPSLHIAADGDRLVIAGQGAAAFQPGPL
ncbi:AbfB domain-containing protein [Actinoplanes sp. NPDC023714]|uniref:AbfB domain-containing protein n=1 Tax=Actinoplanes sp. NPDC023714 TaxID=3154322 RepID=UPI0033E7B612